MNNVTVVLVFLFPNLQEGFETYELLIHISNSNSLVLELKTLGVWRL